MYRIRMRGTIGLVAALLVAGCETRTEDPKPAASGAPASSAAAAAASARPEAKPKTSAAPVREGGSIARALEDDALFVADEDHEVVRAIALPARAKSARADFHAPGRPAQVIVTRDRVLVTIRQIKDGEGALLVLKRKAGLELEEIGRVALPVDAWGIALSPDESTALVTSAWSHRLSAVDLDQRQVKWSIDVAREPRGVVMLSSDRAYVSHLVGSAVTRVDGISKEPIVKRVDLPASPLRTPANAKLDASLGYSVAASPEGDRLYFPRHALGAMGSQAWYGAATVDVLTTANDAALAPMRSPAPTAHFVEHIQARVANHESWDVDGTGPAIEADGRLNSPRAIVFRKKTRTILVVSEGSDGVIELDAEALDPTLVVVHGYGTGRKVDPVLGIAEHGEAPAGLVLSGDEDTAYVFCRATDDLVVLDLLPDASSYRMAPRPAVSLGPEEDKSLRRGRALFYDGLNGTLSGGASCASCHPEGRDDGHVWHEAKVTLKSPAVAGGGDAREDHFTNFFATTDVSAIAARWGEITAEGEGGFGYARQTPIIAGRVKAQGPYGWHGESPDLPARLLAGFGLHRWNAGSDNETMKRAYANDLVKFLREGLVPPPRVDKPLSAEEARGKEIFTSAATKCSTCHTPGEYTDRSVVSLKKINPPRGFSEDPNALYKVPSLLYVGGSAPYMHDGRFETLESLIEYNQDRMGATSQLSAEDRKALIAFLRTL
jgi:DNA-binding beta-propeller fold protein YncE/mono/diheme cytochrome c family protein